MGIPGNWQMWGARGCYALRCYIFDCIAIWTKIWNCTKTLKSGGAGTWTSSPCASSNYRNPKFEWGSRIPDRFFRTKMSKNDRQMAPSEMTIGRLVWDKLLSKYMSTGYWGLSRIYACTKTLGMQCAFENKNKLPGMRYWRTKMIRVVLKDKMLGVSDWRKRSQE